MLPADVSNKLINIMKNNEKIICTIVWNSVRNYQSQKFDNSLKIARARCRIYSLSVHQMYATENNLSCLGT